MRRLFVAAFLLLAAAPLSSSAAARPYATGGAQGETSLTIEAGEMFRLPLKFKNTGGNAWNRAGKKYVSLYAAGPYLRKSIFKDASWPTAYQAAKLEAATVKPGQTGAVNLALRAPSEPGTYREQFQLAIENTGWVYGAATRLTITVVPKKITAATPVNAEAFAVMDAETGEWLATRNPDEVRSVASITKLMTVLVAHDAGLDAGRIVALTRDDEVGGGRLRVAVGTELSVHELVASAIIGSANNAAQALARVTGLSQEEFVTRMNAKAAALGLAHTGFADPTGIEVPNLSTAREVVLMAKAAFSDDWIAPLAGQPTYAVATSAGEHPIKNTNKLTLDSSVQVVAGKTGFIYEAGYTLVTRLRREGKHDLIIAVLGCDTTAQPFRDAKILAEQVWLSPSIALASR